jgi:L-asparaginase
MMAAERGDTIHFLITGGTIDSFYDGKADTTVPHKHSVVPDYIRGMKIDDTVFTEICMKDSRSLNQDDRRKLAGAIEKSPHRLFIITHGTYTMPDTARYLEANLRRKGIVAVLTGSMIPLGGFTGSDAGFNLGYSVAKIRHLRPGIYVCMNGGTFKPREVAKLMSEGKFISILKK